MANTPAWAIGAGALAILGGIAALVAARRRKTTKFEDSIISGTDIKTNTVFGSTGGGVVNTGENSLASDFSREGLGNIDTDEVDPIAEAEVYLAYGRDAQAEEILKDALKKDPQRQEIYLKLLEIHAQHNKPSAFETVASELYSVSQGQGEVWQKAVALGRQLDPNNPMFAEGGAPRAAPAAARRLQPPRDGRREGASFVPDITPVEGAGQERSRSTSSSTRRSRSRRRRARQPDDAVRTGRRRSSAQASRWTSPAIGAPRPRRGRARSPRPRRRRRRRRSSRRSSRCDARSREKFDLDFQLDDNEKPEPMAQARAADAGRPRRRRIRSARRLVADAAGRGDRARQARPGFDPDRATFEDPTPSVLDGQWHDAATKLDLAKAYQEMGDVEGAREILQEVLHEGDDQQKSEAQSLLAKLG